MFMFASKRATQGIIRVRRSRSRLEADPISVVGAEATLGSLEIRFVEKADAPSLPQLDGLLSKRLPTPTRAP